ncbi:MAG: adenylate/guanylate cyclase domain-containing protein [Leptospiraceae bacterium]|nr:adenylate/guanylate cyclase domain-containing protein [Leptospiraceae bacterium]
MIFFGDPKTEGEQKDALNCVCMALEMKSYMEYKWKQFERGEINNAFKIRIGINTGDCTVGNFGSENRMDYSIIGREVNLAGKLEQKADPMSILISETTYELIKEEIECIKKEPISKKGNSNLMSTYQVIDRKVSNGRNSKIENKGDGYSIVLDLSKVDKNFAIEKLEEALQKLRN